MLKSCAHREWNVFLAFFCTFSSVVLERGRPGILAGRRHGVHFPSTATAEAEARLGGDIHTKHLTEYNACLLRETQRSRGVKCALEQDGGAVGFFRWSVGGVDESLEGRLG